MSSSSSSQTPQRVGADDLLNPSTSQRVTPPQSRPAKISERVIDDDFGDWKFPKASSDNSKIKRFLKHVWVDVEHVIQNDPDLGGHLANYEEFYSNVKRKGEWEFIDSLKVMAESRLWAPLFDDGTLLFLRLEVL